jgi:protein involved in sex pheromone biosynthesis
VLKFINKKMSKMKKIIISVVAMACILVSCDQKSSNRSNHMNDESMMTNDDSTMMLNKSNIIENHEKMYACSMHPEVIGKKDEKCSKCGMKLTEPVNKKKEENK